MLHPQQGDPPRRHHPGSTIGESHAEHPENTWDPQVDAPARADVVVVAGDVSSPLAGAIDWLADRAPGARVVYVPGNHCFWGMSKDDRYSYQDVVLAGRERAAARGIDLLVEGETVEIDGVRFCGGTLWTDMVVRPPWLPMSGAMSEANKRMNDYRRVRFGGNRSKDHLDPRDTVYLHRQTRARIEAILKAPFDGPTVVVTHHAPHPACLPEPDFDLSWCYASQLGPLIERTNPSLWLHGHLHGQVDVQIGKTRIVANARGHVDEPSCALFDPSLVIEVEELTPAPGFA